VTHVFHEPDGAPVNEKRFYAAWHVACVAAGLPAHIPHDFRRTATRNLVRAGVPEDVAMKLTGHKTRSVFAGYNVTGGKDLEHVAEQRHAYLTKPAAQSRTVGKVRQFTRTK
jgi:integrase